MKDNGPSRRAVLGGAALGPAGIGGTAVTQTANGSATGGQTPARPLTDPRSKHTSVPFPEQKQP